MRDDTDMNPYVYDRTMKRVERLFQFGYGIVSSTNSR
jgi:hypothetical protein